MSAKRIVEFMKVENSVSVAVNPDHVVAIGSAGGDNTTLTFTTGDEIAVHGRPETAAERLGFEWVHDDDIETTGSNTIDDDIPY